MINIQQKKDESVLKEMFYDENYFYESLICVCACCVSLCVCVCVCVCVYVYVGVYVRVCSECVVLFYDTSFCDLLRYVKSPCYVM